MLQNKVFPVVLGIVCPLISYGQTVLVNTDLPGSGPFGDGTLGYAFGGAAYSLASDPSGGGGDVAKITTPAAGSAGGEGVRFSYGFGGSPVTAFPSDIAGAEYSFSFDVYFEAPSGDAGHDGVNILARWYDSSGTTNKGETAPTYDGTTVGSGYNSVLGFALPDETSTGVWHTVTMAGYTAPINSSAAGGPVQHLEFNIFTNASDATTDDQVVYLRNVQLSYVPEPSAYALITGALVLASVVYRRRH